MEENRSIKIHHISSPVFMYGGEKHYVETRIIKDFSDIDSLIQRHLNYCEKKNITAEWLF